MKKSFVVVSFCLGLITAITLTFQNCAPFKGQTSDGNVPQSSVITETETPLSPTPTPPTGAVKQVKFLADFPTNNFFAIDGGGIFFSANLSQTAPTITFFGSADKGVTWAEVGTASIPLTNASRGTGNVTGFVSDSSGAVYLHGGDNAGVFFIKPSLTAPPVRVSLAGPKYFSFGGVISANGTFYGGVGEFEKDGKFYSSVASLKPPATTPTFLDEQLSSGPAGTVIWTIPTKILLDPKGAIIVVGRYRGAVEVVRRSEDNGATWTTISEETGVPSLSHRRESGPPAGDLIRLQQFRNEFSSSEQPHLIS